MADIDVAPPYTDQIDAMDGCKLYRADDGSEISIIARWDHVEAHCHGDLGHFREDGGCEHMDDLLAVQKPGRDVRILPFGGRAADEQLYTYAWGNNEERARLKGRTCRVVARAGRGGMNTVLVEFLDTGERVSTSLRSIRRIPRDA